MSEFHLNAICGLVTGAKIYSFRVDNLHSDAYRVANVLGSNKRDDEEGQENMDIEAGMEGAGGRMDDEIPAALKKKRKRNFKCIVSDLSKIHKRVNHNVEHDALYQKASMVIGNTRPTDLLSMHMPVTDCERREKIVIDGSTKVSFPSQNLEGSHFPMIPKSVLNLLEAKAVSQLSLCQSVDKIMEMLDVTSNEHDEDANEGF